MVSLMWPKNRFDAISLRKAMKVRQNATTPVDDSIVSGIGY